MTLSREEIRRVRALAKQAAPAPWFVVNENEGEQSPLWVIVNADFDKEETPDDAPIPLQAVLHYGAKADADFIAECDPETILALCDAAERGAEVTEEVSEIVKGWRESVRDCDDDVGDVVREFADSIEAALGIDRPTPEEAGK